MKKDNNLTINCLTPNKDKIRILTTGDDPRLQTGFGIVHSHILTELYKNEDYQIVTAGWTPPRDSRTESRPLAGDGLNVDNNTDWNIVDCKSFMFDNHASDTLPRMYKVFQPHVILSIGDAWMLNPVYGLKKQHPNKFNWIAYTPIDGFPLKDEFAEILNKADNLVAYSSWAKNIIEEKLPQKDIWVINHGVDEKTFYPLNEDKKELRNTIGLNDIDFLVGWVARNTPRKRADIAIKAFAYFKSASLSCSNCLIEIFEVNETGHIKNSQFEKINKNEKVECSICNKEMVYTEPKKNVKLYLHTPVDEKEGFALESLSKEFGINGSVLHPDKVIVGQGVNKNYMNILYNSFDVTFNSAEAEGWGMPIHESMACRVPVVVPNFGGYLGDLVRPFETGFVAENEALNRDYSTNYIRALPSGINIALLLDLVYYSKINQLDVFLKRWNISEYKLSYIYNIIKEYPNIVENVIDGGYNQAIDLKWNELASKFNLIIQETTPEIKKKELLSNISTENNLLAISDISSTKDMFFAGPEKFFRESLNLFKDQYNIHSVGYAENKKPVFDISSNKEDDINVWKINYNSVKLKELIDAFRPKVLFSFGYSLNEVYSEALSQSIPLISFVPFWDLLCGNPLRMATCKYNCQSCSSYLDKNHIGVHEMYLKALNYSSILVFPSKFASETFNKLWGNKIQGLAEKSLVLYPDVNENDKNIISSNYNMNEDAKFITLMSSKEEKGALLFAEMAMNLPEFDFLSVDPQGETVRNLFSFVEEKVGNLTSTPRLQKPIEVYSHSKLVLVPSVWKEPFSRVVFEAALNGIPVLAANHSGMSELLPKSVLIDDYYNLNEWVKRIQEVMTDYKLRQKMLVDINKSYVTYRNSYNNQKNHFKNRINDLLKEEILEV